MNAPLDSQPDLGALLNELRTCGIRLEADGDALRVRGARAALTPELTERIKRSKRELLVLLCAERESGTVERIVPRGPEAEVPLSFLQQNLWLIDQLEGSIQYNMAVALRLEGPLDVAALEQALNTIVARHESLRTVFGPGRELSLAQLVQEQASLKLPCVDLSHLAAEAREERARVLYSEEARRPFNLSTDLMLRGQLVRLDAQHSLLLLTLHHIAGDGWSMDVLLEEMSRLYAAAVQRQPLALPPLPVQYGDYALWLVNRLQGPSLEQKLEYWQRRLAGLPAVHSLPLDRPRPAYRTIHGGRHVRQWSAPAAQALHALCAKNEVTLFMLLEAGVAALLAHWSGERDIAIGTPVTSRNRPELAPLIGYLTNTVVLRSDVDQEQTFAEFLQQTRRTMLEALEHHDVPFEMLVDKLNPGRSLAHNALVQIIIMLQNNRAATFGSMDVAGLRIAPLTDRGDGAVKFDLELTVRETADGLQLKWDYNRDIFDAATIERMDRQYGLLLDAVIADAGRPLWQLGGVAPQDLALQAAWNDTAVPFPATDTLAGMVEAAAARHPQACALVSGQQSLSYEELNGRANRLARYLLANHDIRPGMHIGHCVARSVDMMVALLAIMKAGGAYVALDAGLPPERLAYMLEDSGAPLVLAGRAEAARLAVPQGVDCLLLDELELALSAMSPEDLPARCRPDSLAYVIYTSGSTGRPKGTLNLHRGPCNRIHAMQRQFDLKPTDRVLQKTPLSFDVSVWEIFWPLSQGATVVLAAPDGHRDSVWLAEAVRAYQITVMHFVPSMLQMFLQGGARGPFPGLRYVMCSGEALSYELQQQAIAAFPGVELINHYGPTETAVEVTWWRFNEVRTDRLVPIGAPLANVRLHILDPHDQPVPVGVPGELHIAGIQVGEGYLNQAELTAAHFVERTVAGRLERLYRTGDRARWLADGQIAYMGRLDNQVKLRGLRIELGEIEAALREQVGVAEAAVVLWGVVDSPHQRLVAYLALERGYALDAMEPALQAGMRQRLPEYMVPAQIVEVERMPVGQNGKLDRRALPAPPEPTQAEEVPPSTPTEEMLVGLWGQVLEHTPASVTAHFFALGGHSLLATQLASVVRRNLGIDMPLRVVFEHPVLRDQARWLDQQTVAGALAPIPVLPETSHAPSDAQRRLWLLGQLEGPNSTYNIPRALRLRGKLDVEALTRAFAAVVERHANLRLCFPGEGGAPVIRLLAPYSPLDTLDLRTLPLAEREAALQTQTRQHAAHAFDLSAEPLLRVRLLLFGEEESVLLVNMHHIISDGWSLGVMMNEVSHLYGAVSTGASPSLPALPVQYGDYAAWQRESMQGERLAQQRDYWLRQLEGAPALLELPWDRPRPAQFSYLGTTWRATLPATLAEQVRSLSQRHGCTMFMTVLAAFQLLLARHSRQDDLLIGTPIAGRSHYQTEPLIGFFVNTLVLRARIDWEQDLARFLAATRKTALEAYQHQDLPFDQLVESLRPVRSLAYTSVFQVMFRYENAAIQRVRMAGLDVSDIGVDTGHAQFDLLLNVIEDSDGLCCEWQFAHELFDAASIERMHDQLAHLLEDMSADRPAQQLAGLSLCSAARQEEALAMARGAAATWQEPMLMHAAFEVQARRTPDAAAVRDERQQLSYAQVYRRANWLAQRLRELGAGPGRCVALSAQRSADMVVAILAILESGAAYIPLDPSYPADRLAYMLDDSRPTVLLTESGLQAQLSAWSGPTLLLDGLPWSEAAAAPVQPGVEAGSLAYIIYTSGSTGRPKGALNAHGASMNHLLWARDYFALGAGDRVLQKTPIGFDVSVWEIFLPLLSGAELVMARPGGHMDPVYLAAVIARQAITLVHFVPSMLAVFLELPGNEQYPSLRTVVASGEALPYALYERFAARFPALQLHDLYGPTETAVHATFKPCTPNEARRGVIGRPIANTSIYLLDARGQLVPPGVAGEMHIAGAGVGLGYLNLPELTAQRFVPDPFAADPAARMYRTGDLARWRADGSIEYLGRNDFQVKLRGLRIELGEIESALRLCAGVHDAVVLVRQDGGDDARLVAYLQADGAIATQAVLRTQLAAMLPGYMIPAAYVLVDAWPLTPNGKLDRQALPAPAGAEQVSLAYEAPLGETEQSLAAIWRELLGIEQIGRHDHFFDLGGHSMLATRCVARVRDAFGVELPLTDIFKQPTLAGCGAVIAELSLKEFDQSAVADLVAQYDELSDEELERLLQRENE
jgi:amino acid adenylation domain-containing protein